MTQTRLVAYTDGACSGNPGPGGWGVLMRAERDGAVLKERELQGGEAQTTNNRMELMAAITGAGNAGTPVRGDHRHRQRLCEERRHAMDSWLEAQWLAHRRPQASEECGTLAAVGCGASAPSRDMGMGQGPCGPPGK